MYLFSENSRIIYQSKILTFFEWKLSLSLLSNLDLSKAVCFIIDLFNREIIGHAISKYHDSNCVLRALASIKFDLNNTRIFHSDRGGEFASCELSEYLKQLNIVQSMSRAGCPYDNAVSENMFKLLKVEGIDRYYQFDSNLILDVNEWVKWYNNVRIHSKINNKSPVMYREQHELKAV